MPNGEKWAAVIGSFFGLLIAGFFMVVVPM